MEYDTPLAVTALESWVAYCQVNGRVRRVYSVGTGPDREPDHRIQSGRSGLGHRVSGPFSMDSDPLSCGTLSPLDSEEAEKKIAVSRMIIEVEQRESCREASMSYCTFDVRIKAE
ncbi:hypothetical protein SAY86_013358 [Trapa natans]|uniref:Uncharacterized protein n=1 Tax=Trapa natans TaxID=22666 RepID=A0AAN7R812_TRANT|nr:hypothetical protein SAY86_013358 [Trapa natans]